MKKLALVFTLLMVLAFSCNVAFAGQQDFTIINKTGVSIEKLFVSPSKANDWGSDILGRDTLPSGDSVDIVFEPGERATFWDIRVEDASGNYLEWDHFNLKEVSKITLKASGVAEYE